MMLDQLAQAVRDGHLHPRSLVEAALERIAAANPLLNAVTEVCGEQALAEADRHDRRGPLAGLPVLVKDLVEARGTRNTLGGMELYADAPTSEQDDPTVAALVAAGAIVVGRTNSPAMGHLGITTNPVFGPTRNPWNRERTPTGSSGGAAAALAAGMAAICTSSDGGGSTRAPAAACGLVGWKPTAGLVTRIGGARSVYSSSSVGALGVTVADCRLEAEQLIGSGVGDLMARPGGPVSLAPRMPKKALACATLTGRCDPAVAEVFERMISRLRAGGMNINWIDAPNTGDALDRFEAVYNAELAASLQSVRGQWQELEASLRWIAEVGEQISAQQLIEAHKARYRLTEIFDRLLGLDTVLLTPTLNILLPGPGERTGPGDIDPLSLAMLEEEMSGAANTMHFNLSGHPAISVPMGHESCGVPMGMQIVAPRWADDLAFGFATFVEELVPWSLCAPGYSVFGSELLKA